MGSMSQFMDPAGWWALVSSGWTDIGHAEFWIALAKIMWINILLSGDNAVVIAMACRGLPHRQRVWGMILGAGVAVGLRVIFTAVVASLMLLPYLKIVGGLALFYIAAKLLVPDDPDESEAEAAEHLWRIEGAKFNKSRLVPLAPSVALALEEYLEQRRSLGLPTHPESVLLWSGRGPESQAAYTLPAFTDIWKRLCLSADVVDERGRPPRVHDLRHSFAVEALHRWYEQGDLVQALVDAGNPVIVIAHRNPFDAMLLPDSVTVLATYGFNPPMIEALSNVLAGKAKPAGILPVDIP